MVQNGHPISGVGVDSSNTLVDDGLQSQDSFGRWMNHMISDSQPSVDESALIPSLTSTQEPYSSVVLGHNQPFSEQVLNLTDVSPASASSTEKTKVSSFCYVFFFWLPR